MESKYPSPAHYEHRIPVSYILELGASATENATYVYYEDYSD